MREIGACFSSQARMSAKKLPNTMSAEASSASTTHSTTNEKTADKITRSAAPRFSCPNRRSSRKGRSICVNSAINESRIASGIDRSEKADAVDWPERAKVAMAETSRMTKQLRMERPIWAYSPQHSAKTMAAAMSASPPMLRRGSSITNTVAK